MQKPWSGIIGLYKEIASVCARQTASTGEEPYRKADGNIVSSLETPRADDVAPDRVVIVVLRAASAAHDREVILCGPVRSSPKER